MKGIMHWLKSSSKMKRWMFLILIGIILTCYGISDILVQKEIFRSWKSSCNICNWICLYSYRTYNVKQKKYGIVYRSNR